jgi:hypothetical protein
MVVDDENSRHRIEMVAGPAGRSGVAIPTISGRTEG